MHCLHAYGVKGVCLALALAGGAASLVMLPVSTGRGASWQSGHGATCKPLTLLLLLVVVVQLLLLLLLLLLLTARRVSHHACCKSPAASRSCYLFRRRLPALPKRPLMVTWGQPHTPQWGVQGRHSPCCKRLCRLTLLAGPNSSGAACR
jgi:hypothetical protein